MLTIRCSTVLYVVCDMRILNVRTLLPSICILLLSCRYPVLEVRAGFQRHSINWGFLQRGGGLRAGRANSSADSFKEGEPEGSESDLAEESLTLSSTTVDIFPT